MKPVRTRVRAYSDVDTDPVHQRLWGDYWFKRHLEDALKQRGCLIHDGTAGLLIHLFGAPIEPCPSMAHRVLWIHSHPDWITPEILGHYTLVFSSSCEYVQIGRAHV